MKRSRSPESKDGQERQRKKATDLTEGTSACKFPTPGDDWSLWGPYLPERQWGTVREDTSTDGNCWESFSHDDATRRAYASGEDGLLGVCDKDGVMCTSVLLWNYKDVILKERLFGLTNPQGNHGEDVKELYYYLDNNPRHSYMRALYKYPQEAFPYQTLVSENAQRGVDQLEYEIVDTGIFSSMKYWDVYTEYAKITPWNLVGCVTAVNMARQTEKLLVAPQKQLEPVGRTKATEAMCPSSVRVSGMYTAEFYSDAPLSILEEIVFTDNESRVLQYKGDNSSQTCFYKDAFHRYIIQDEKKAVNPQQRGTKCAGIYKLVVPPSEERKIYWTIQDSNTPRITAVSRLQDVIDRRKAETKIFFSKLMHPDWSRMEETLAHQAVAGLLWSKQFYMYDVADCMKKFRMLHDSSDDSSQKTVMSVPRNENWQHLKNSDIIAVPDKWEFPWYAPWDLAFHMIPYAHVDIEFCKRQLELFLTDRYMRKDGQLPGCEFDLDDPNPPLHPWACLAVFRGDREQDLGFLSRCYNKLQTTYDWWMSCLSSSSLYTAGGFLGMDNISVFNRSQVPYGGYTLSQADGTAWVALCSLNMMEMALKLVTSDPQYVHQSERFIDNFLRLSVQMNRSCFDGGLWHPQDKFYYDVLSSDGDMVPVRVKSLVGLVALFAVAVVDISDLPTTSHLARRLDSCTEQEQQHVYKIADSKYHLSLVPKSRLTDIMAAVCDPKMFLSPFGIRSLAKMYEREPYSLVIGDETYTTTYAPGESTSDMFGGNSNWRGPIWLCMNYLLMESLDRASESYGRSYRVAYPTGLGQMVPLSDIAADIARRIVNIFLPGSNGARPVHGSGNVLYTKPGWDNLILFYEFFHAESGQGCGASHQTGWTALVVEFLRRKYRQR